MNWQLRKPNVALAVTKFAPETEPLFAGLTPEAREAHRAKRAAECAKVEPAIDLSADVGFDEPDRYDDYTASWQEDYAQAVGISRHKEL